jgi:hypothetical protein
MSNVQHVSANTMRSGLHNLGTASPSRLYQHTAHCWWHAQQLPYQKPPAPTPYLEHHNSRLLAAACCCCPRQHREQHHLATPLACPQSCSQQHRQVRAGLRTYGHSTASCWQTRTQYNTLPHAAAATMMPLKADSASQVLLLHITCCPKSFPSKAVTSPAFKTHPCQKSVAHLSLL